MKIVVALTGRSHLLNVAKSLLEIGHDVTFFTCIPKSRCLKFGFPKEKVVSFFPFFGFLFIYRSVKVTVIRNLLLGILDWLTDIMTSVLLKKCDVFIGASAVMVRSIKVAKEKYNAITICDVGTKHVKVQSEILQGGPKAIPIAQSTVDRELVNYEQADYITVPARHVLRTFLDQGFSREKVFVNPYGCNVSRFHPTVLNENCVYDVIMVGTWRYIKGVDVLAKACIESKLHLLHVGGVFPNCDIPLSEFIHHVDPVDEDDLIKYYSMAKVFALPSRAEGLSLVQVQAIMCGLPVVYTADTGGEDLKELAHIADSYMIKIDELNVDILAKALKRAVNVAQDFPRGVERRYCSDKNLLNLTWGAYAHRYNEFLRKIKNV